MKGAEGGIARRRVLKRHGSRPDWMQPPQAVVCFGGVNGQTVAQPRFVHRERKLEEYLCGCSTRTAYIHHQIEASRISRFIKSACCHPLVLVMSNLNIGQHGYRDRPHSTVCASSAASGVVKVVRTYDLSRTHHLPLVGPRISSLSPSSLCKYTYHRN